jgi:hypothetical protein
MSTNKTKLGEGVFYIGEASTWLELETIHIT